MRAAPKEQTGLALGAWGAVQATATGLAMAGGGALRDIVSEFAVNGSLGSALTGPAVGYAFVYNVEVLFLFATLVAIGPLAAFTRRSKTDGNKRFGLAEFPS